MSTTITFVVWLNRGIRKSESRVSITSPDRAAKSTTWPLLTPLPAASVTLLAWKPFLLRNSIIETGTFSSSKKRSSNSTLPRPTSIFHSQLSHEPSSPIVSPLTRLLCSNLDIHAKYRLWRGRHRLAPEEAPLVSWFPPRPVCHRGFQASKLCPSIFHLVSLLDA